MASSRRLPTSYNTSTYGNATRNYTSLATWEAATDNDLVTAANGEVLECYDDAASFDDNVTVDGATTSSSYFRVIKPSTGQGHDGTPNNGVTFAPSSFLGSNPYWAIKIGEDYGQVHDLIVLAEGNSAGNIYAYVIQNAGVNDAAFVGCIGKGTNSGTGLGSSFMIESAGGFFINCLAYEFKTYGFLFSTASGIAYNCTAVDGEVAFLDSGSTSTCINCIACDCTTDFSNIDTKTTCYEGDATVFVNQAGDDYHLAAADTTCRGNGTNLSADGTYAFDDDIDGGTRSAWDIGADEYGSVAPTGWTGKIWGVTNPAKIWGIDVANIAKVGGV